MSTEPFSSAPQADRPRTVAMMIFLNVVLGISLWQAISTCQAGPSGAQNHDNYFVLATLFLIYLANLLRAFLGFVSFYVKFGLSEPQMDSKWNELFLRKRRIYWLRAADFVLGGVTAAFLIPLASACGSNTLFRIWFVVISVLFFARNFGLWMIYYRDPRGNIRKVFLDNQEAVLSWWVLDLIILVASVVWLLPRPTDSSFFVLLLLIGSVLLIASIIDIYINLEYYFSDTDDSCSPRPS